jgi:hypothetical protein
MSATKPVHTRCPYCAAPIELIIDCSVASQEYVEDCEVCCRPMTVVITIHGDGEIYVDLRQEDE